MAHEQPQSLSPEKKMSDQNESVDWLVEVPAASIPAQQPSPVAPPDFDLDDSLEDGIVRVKIRRDGQRTSVSLDETFHRAGVMLLGSTRLFEGWIQDQVNILDIRWAERGAAASIGDQVKPKAGLSRLIQRRLLQLIIQNIQTSNSGEKHDGTA